MTSLDCTKTILIWATARKDATRLGVLSGTRGSNVGRGVKAWGQTYQSLHLSERFAVRRLRGNVVPGSFCTFTKYGHDREPA